MHFKIFLLILFLGYSISADFLSDASKTNFSVRSMGRGGSGTAQPYGSNSLTSNPAGLAQSGSGIYFNNLDYSDSSDQYAQSTMFHRRQFGVGSWRIESGEYALDTFGVGIGRQNRNGVDWGLTYRSMTYSELGIDKKLWSSDLGFIIHLNRGLDVGFLGKDVLGSGDFDISPSIETGFLYKNRDASLKVFSDVVVDRNHQVYDSAYVRLGMDVNLSKDFTVRVGGDQLYYTAGASFDVFFFSVDYAVKRPKDENQETVYALGFKLGQAKPPEEFRRKYALFKPSSIAYLEINGALTSGYSSISLLGGKKIGSNDVIRLIQMANKDEDCQAFLIRIKSLDSDLSNVALVQEIRSELHKSRLMGKKVYVYLDGWAPLPSYYLASVADKVVMPQMGAIHQLGIQLEVLKFDELMKKFGVSYHSINSGKYKVSTSSLTEPLTISQKNTINESLENIMAQVKSDIQSDRDMSWSENGNIYDGKIISSTKALKYGLVDGVGFWRDMVDIIKEDFSNEYNDVVLVSIDEYQTNEDDYLWSPFNKIAVVEINGPISSGRNTSNFIFGDIQTGSDEISFTFQQLSKDPFLRGVVLRINSPGGSILASDQILNAVNEFKALTRKPVYASMGTFAASGGYYVALGSDKIFANPATITGSIGVFSGFMNFYDLQKEWGISSESLSTGKYMDSMSPHQEFSASDKAMIQEHQYGSYQHFKSLVQDARQMTDDEVVAVSQGQFLSGSQAKDIGLVDEIGTYTDAVSAMEDELKLSQSRVVVYGRPQQKSPFDILSFLFDL